MDIDFEKEYSPSQWSKRFDGDDVINNHVRFVKQESERIRETISFETHAYGTEPAENFDLFGLDLPDDAPLLVYIHGGYWQELSKTLSAYLVGPLHAAGFKVLVLEYELCPKITLTKLVSQICKAAEYINEYAEKKGSRNVSYAGHSAGAHLIQCMIDQLLRTASNSYNRLHSLFLISGVYDLRDLRETSINCNNMLSLSDDNVLSLSPAMFDYSGWPSNLNVEIFVGQNDSPTFITQSKNLHNLLQDTSKLHSTYTIVPDCDHFELVELLSSPTYQITKSILAITQ